MRVYYHAANPDLILRSPPKAGVSKDNGSPAASYSRLSKTNYLTKSPLEGRDFNSHKKI